MSEHKRYFHVVYSTGSITGEIFITTTGSPKAPYINKIKAKSDILSRLFNGGDTLVIMNVMELTESDYMDFIEGLDTKG